jgi:hypothetical protein
MLPSVKTEKQNNLLLCSRATRSMARFLNTSKCKSETLFRLSMCNLLDQDTHSVYFISFQGGSRTIKEIILNFKIYGFL